MNTIYVLFEGDVYYPLGGFDDFSQFIDATSDEDAIAVVRALPDRRYEWRQLVAIENGAWRRLT